MSESTDQPIETPANEEAPNLPRPDELHFLEPPKLSFRRENGRLQMKLEGEEEWQEVILWRLFALTEPEKWISVANKEDKEIGVLMELHGLSAQSIACVRDELYRRYLVPEISRIYSCRQRLDMVEWNVETDRGRVTFLVRHHHDQTQQTLPRRVALTDVEGNRYDIPDVEELDPESRKLLEQRT